jgi:hypothetical protein
VGGPSSANLAHLSTFLAAAHDTRLPVDFLSSHHYPSDPSCSRSGPHAASPGCFVADVLDAAAVAEAAGKPFYLTEYKHGLQGGPGTGFGGRHGDTAYAAAFIMHTVPQLSSLHVLSWWSISDIFEENWMIGKPFYGGYGLLTVHGVAKPAFRAFQLLAGAGTRRVSSVGIRDEAPGCALACGLQGRGRRLQGVGRTQEGLLCLEVGGPMLDRKRSHCHWLLPCGESGLFLAHTPYSSEGADAAVCFAPVRSTRPLLRPYIPPGYGAGSPRQRPPIQCP